ncbi:MAG: hypothetical protein ACC645_27250, partial [Pirellulales bacterium]
SIVFQEAGSFVIPEIRLSWWNYASKTVQEVVVPSYTLTVAENPDLDPDLVSIPDAATDSTAAAAAAAATRKWTAWWPLSLRTLLVGSLLLLAILVVLRFVRRRTRETLHESGIEEDAESTWFKRFEDAAAGGNQKAVRRQFTFWLDRRSGAPKGEAESAAEFAALSNDVELALDLNHLDEDLYSRHSHETSEHSGGPLSRIGAGVRNVRRGILAEIPSGDGPDTFDLPSLNPKQ